jgi:hypothetical protein
MLRARRQAGVLQREEARVVGRGLGRLLRALAPELEQLLQDAALARLLAVADALSVVAVAMVEAGGALTGALRRVGIDLLQERRTRSTDSCRL